MAKLLGVLSVFCLLLTTSCVKNILCNMDKKFVHEEHVSCGETQSFSFKMNSQIWNPTGNTGLLTPKSWCNEIGQSNNRLTICKRRKITDCENDNEILYQQDLQFEIDGITGVGNYNFNDANRNVRITIEDEFAGCDYNFDDSQNMGSLNVTCYDAALNRVSGNFSFNFVDCNNNIIEVTEGRFNIAINN